MACNKFSGLNCDGLLATEGCASPRRDAYRADKSHLKINAQILVRNIISTSAKRLSFLSLALLIVKGTEWAQPLHVPALSCHCSTHMADLPPAARMSHVCVRATRSHNLVSLKPRQPYSLQAVCDHSCKIHLSALTTTTPSTLWSVLQKASGSPQEGVERWLCYYLCPYYVGRLRPKKKMACGPHMRTYLSLMQSCGALHEWPCS